MNKLEDVDTGKLRDVLAKASSVKAAKRLMIALAYADDVRVEMLNDRYGIPCATVYSWLDRFEHQSISEAIEDESRPGRPLKLDASQCKQLLDDLREPPAEVGYDTLVIRHPSTVGFIFSENDAVALIPSMVNRGRPTFRVAR